MTKGLLIYYLNRNAFNNFDEEKLLDFIKKTNTNMVKESESRGYPVMFIPTTHEATRVEKVDF